MGDVVVAHRGCPLTADCACLGAAVPTGACDESPNRLPVDSIMLDGDGAAPDTLDPELIAYGVASLTSTVVADCVDAGSVIVRVDGAAEVALGVLEDVGSLVSSYSPVANRSALVATFTTPS